MNTCLIEFFQCFCITVIKSLCSAFTLRLLTARSLVPDVTGLLGLITVIMMFTIILMVNNEDVRLRVLGQARAVIIGAGYLQAGRGLLLLSSLSCGESPDLVIICLRRLQRGNSGYILTLTFSLDLGLIMFSLLPVVQDRPGC